MLRTQLACAFVYDTSPLRTRHFTVLFRLLVEFTGNSFKNLDCSFFSQSAMCCHRVLHSSKIQCSSTNMCLKSFFLLAHIIPVIYPGVDDGKVLTRLQLCDLSNNEFRTNPCSRCTNQVRYNFVRQRILVATVSRDGQLT